MSREIWKQVVRFGKMIDGYKVSNMGRVRGPKGNVLIPVCKKNPYKKTKDGNQEESSEDYKKQKSASALRVTISFDDDIFPDYKYSKRSYKGRSRLTINIHKLVMDAFKPIDEYPPISKEEWDKTPESAKQLIRDTVFIDHINDDPYDNRVENLRWVTPLQNSNYRKQREKMTAKTKNKNNNKTPLERLMK